MEIEETLTQDIRWRRNAFAIQDYVDLTSEFKIRFVASDSLRQGQEFSGGSLIEAAVDDLLILDLASLGVEDLSASSEIVAWPVPAINRLHSAGWDPGCNVQLFDATGKLLLSSVADFRGHACFDLPDDIIGSAVITGMRRLGQLGAKKVLIGGQ